MTASAFSKQSIRWLLLGASLACTATPKTKDADSSAQTEPSVHALLARELQRRLNETDIPSPPLSVTEGTTRYETRVSTAVPDLRYELARWGTLQGGHGNLVVYAGSRGGRSRILHDATDWSELSSGWRPADANAVRQACTEVVQAVNNRLGSGLDFYDGVPTTGDDPFLGESPRLKLRVKERVAIRPPVAADSSWVLTGWVIRPSYRVSAKRYECRVPTTVQGSRKSVSLVLRDSIFHGP